MAEDITLIHIVADHTEALTLFAADIWVHITVHTAVHMVADILAAVHMVVVLTAAVLTAAVLTAAVLTAAVLTAADTDNFNIIRYRVVAYYTRNSPILLNGFYIFIK
jgi:hypothetical protein